MGNFLNVFKTSAFDVISMTEAVNKLPHQPGRIGQMGLFKRKGIFTDVVTFEEKDGKLSLIQSVPRGSAGAEHSRETRRARSFKVPHLPLHDTIMADDVLGVRAFGTDNELETISGIVNDRLEEMRQGHEVTLEFHRAKALQGYILDADGTPLFNFWDEFNITERSVDFVFGTAATSIRNKILAAKRLVETALGAGTYDHIHCLCGATFFDALTSHADVKAAFARWQDGAFLRNDPRAGFEFAEVIFEEYRGTVSGQDFIPAAQGRFFPVGVNGLFRTLDAPANYVETVGTQGKPVYAKQELMKFGKGIEMETQSNPFNLPVRPACLVKGYSST